MAVSIVVMEVMYVIMESITEGRLINEIRVGGVPVSVIGTPVAPVRAVIAVRVAVGIGVIIRIGDISVRVSVVVRTALALGV
jgi:hypothetical protein